jgi:hypothetical protein
MESYNKKTITRFLTDLGRLKVAFERAKGYLGLLNFVMIGYLFIERSGFRWWYLGVIPLAFIIMIVDIKYILPAQNEYLMTRSKSFRRLLK